jgi:hypothetical protein
MSREEFVGAELVGVEEEAVEAVAANAHERHELFTSAAASGRWEDAKACRPGFRLRQVRLLSGTDPEGSDQ